MSESDVAMLKGEMETLKAITSEKWNSHDTRADERWSDLMDKLHEMERKLDSHPCKLHGELMIEMNTRVKTLEKDKDTLYKSVWAIFILVAGGFIAMVFEFFKRRG